MPLLLHFDTVDTRIHVLVKVIPKIENDCEAVLLVSSNHIHIEIDLRHVRPLECHSDSQRCGMQVWVDNMIPLLRRFIFKDEEKEHSKVLD